jgi:hypothetical protein
LEADGEREVKDCKENGEEIPDKGLKEFEKGW